MISRNFLFFLNSRIVLIFMLKIVLTTLDYAENLFNNKFFGRTGQQSSI